MIPTLEVEEVAVNPIALDARPLLWEFPIAKRIDGVYQYEHKVKLSNGGSVLQVLSQAADGGITESLPENAFDLTQEPLAALLVDVHGNGSEFKLRLQTSTLPDPLSITVLAPNVNRQIQIAQMSYTQGADVIETLGFIGADDIRIGFSGRFTRMPGESFQINYEAGTQNIVLLYS